MRRSVGRALDISRATWPRELEVLGDMRGGQPFARCFFCDDASHPASSMTFVRYGARPVCLDHARALAGRQPAFVLEALRRAEASAEGAGDSGAREVAVGEGRA